MNIILLFNTVIIRASQQHTYSPSASVWTPLDEYDHFIIDS